MIRDPSNHEQVLSAMFAGIEAKHRKFVETIDKDGNVHPGANPWALQFMRDFTDLSKLWDDAAQAFTQQWDGTLKHLFSEEIKELVLKVDPKLIRSSKKTSEVPPPGYHPPLTLPLSEPLELPKTESKFICRFIVNGKEHSPCKEPNQYERYGLSPSDGHLDENHFHDDVGDGLHDAIDSIVEGHGGF